MKIDDIKRQPILLMFAVIIVIILLVGIFRTIAPYLSLGFGAYAHIGDVRGAISFETFENDYKGEVIIFTTTSCGYCNQLKEDIPKDSEGKLVLPEGIRNIDIDKNPEFSAGITGVPAIRFYKQALTPENVNDSNVYVEYSGDRNLDGFKEFLNEQRTNMMADSAPAAEELS
jgi:hypothetical protein